MRRSQLPQTMLVILGAFGPHLHTAPAWAKGLDQLSDANPAEGGEAPATDEAKDVAATKEATVPASALSTALAKKLQVTTGFGMVRGGLKSGTWKANGMADLTVAYRIAQLQGKLPLSATYRYAPVALTGTDNSLSYRGVVEQHLFGAKVEHPLAAKLTAVGTAELGLAVASLYAVDGLPGTVPKGGVVLGIGGGVDYAFASMPGFQFGPRLAVGVGGLKTMQLTGAASFLF